MSTDRIPTCFTLNSTLGWLPHLLDSCRFPSTPVDSVPQHPDATSRRVYERGRVCEGPGVEMSMLNSEVIICAKIKLNFTFARAICYTAPRIGGYY